jgi:hypothetical protein
MAPLYDKIVAADALILGPVVYFGKANAFTHTFLERFFPLRHLKPQTIGKLAAVVCVGGDEAKQVVRDVSYQLHSYFEYRVVGSVFFNSATPPCFICGYGTTCEYGGPARWMTSEQFEKWRRLTEDYRDDIVKLHTLIGRDLSHWLPDGLAGQQDDAPHDATPPLTHR